MQVKLDEFKTGWFGLEIGLTDSDVASLIEKLSTLREHRGHFHARGDFSGESGVGDIQFYWAEPSAPVNLVLE